MRLLDFILGPKKSRRESYEEAAAVIEAFVDSSSGKWDWDDFTSPKKKDPFLESVRQRCLAVYDDYPAKREGRYCSDEGLDVLRAIAREVRVEIASLQKEEAIQLPETTRGK